MHKKYITRSGKRHGPYFYTCIRDKKGAPKSFYLGSDPRKARKKEKEIKSRFESREPPIPRMVIPLVVVVLLAVAFSADLNLTGFLVKDNVLSYNQALNLELNKTEEGVIYLDEHPEDFYIKSIALSGSVVGNGTARVYIENSIGERYLVFDNTKKTKGFDLTGMMTANNTSNAASEAGENMTEENVTLPEGNITTPENETNITLPENITEPVTEEPDAVVFSNVCMETCVLTEADGFNLSEYALLVEIGPNTTLVLDNMSYSVENITVMPNQVKIEPEIRDARGNLLRARIKFLKKGELELETYSAPESPAPLITALAVPALDKGVYDVEIEPEGHIVKKIHLKDVHITSDLTELVNLDDSPETGVFVEVYAIDPTALDFTEATVTVTAKGTQLYKCKDWNFASQACEGDWALFKTGLVPGQEYTFTLTPEDPAFGELIEITKAMHLDHKRNFIEDVYGYVKERDGNWTEIPKNNYLRVTFEKNLTSRSEIIIYAKSGGGNVEVYGEDSDDLIAGFGTINEDKEYKVLLASLSTSQDTFDLKAVGESIEFDYVVDPSYYVNLTVNGNTGNCVFDLGSTWDQANSSDNYRSLFSGATCGWTVEDWTLGNVIIEDVIVFVEHVGETGIAAGSVTLYVGNSTNLNLYGSAILSDFESVQNKLEDSQGASLAAEGTDTYNFSDPSTIDRLNDLVIRIRNTDSNDEAGVDHIIVQVRYSLFPPTVNLGYPPDKYYNDTNRYVNLTFNASVSDDYGLVNCSLWHNVTGAWHRNQTQTVTGTSNVTVFDLTNLTNVTFIWNIECYDNSNLSSFNNTNRTVVLNLTNQPPTHTNPILNSTTGENITSDNLTCWNRSTSDLDGDDVKNIFNWYRNSTSIMVLNMPFEGGSTPNRTRDYSPYGNNGTVNAAIWNSTLGYDGKGAYQFDGSTTRYINLGRPASLDFSGNDNFTISAWMRVMGNTGTHRPAVCKGDTQYCLKPHTSNTFEFCVYDTTWRCTSSTSTIAEGNWYHVVGRVSGNEVSIWVNGTQEGTPVTHNGVNSNAYNVTIGYEEENPTRLFNGIIDDVRIYNRPLSAAEIQLLYQNRTDMMVSSETSLGDVWQCGVTPNDGKADGISLLSNNLTIVTPDFAPPTWSNNKTNSSGTTKTQESVYFNVTLTDDIAGGYQVFSFYNGTDWYNDTAQTWSTPEELQEIRTVTATRGQTIQWYWWFNDSIGNSNQTDTWSFIVANTPPTTPTLLSPEDGNITTNRTPKFSWNPSTDADNDPVNYTLNITCIGGCSDDNREYSTTDTNFTLPAELRYFGDDGYYYVWNVRAWDGYDYSGHSETRNFTVNTKVVLTLINDTVNFGSMMIGQTDNTTDDDPPPFMIQNDGNCFIDVNISASDLLWDTKATASEFFQYKADNTTGEEKSFNWSASLTAFTNVPTVDDIFLKHLNYTDSSDSAEIDLKIEVPLDEPAGDKSSIIVLTGMYVGA